MSLEKIIKDLINDVEKLKAVGGESDILDEIFNFSESFSFSDTLTVNDSNTKFTFAETMSFAAVLSERSEAAPDSFVYGTALYGFSEYA